MYKTILKCHQGQKVTNCQLSSNNIQGKIKGVLSGFLPSNNKEWAALRYTQTRQISGKEKKKPRQRSSLLEKKTQNLGKEVDWVLHLDRIFSARMVMLYETTPFRHQQGPIQGN